METRRATLAIAGLIIATVFATAQQPTGPGPGPLGIGTHTGGLCFSNGVMKVGLNNFGALGVDGPCGFQYPVGAEHLAIGWWGEGYYIEYDGVGFYFYPSNGGPDPLPDTPPVLSTYTTTVLGTNFNVAESTYNTKDGVLNVKHTLYIPTGKKWVIIKATLIALKPINDLYYKRVVDWDVLGFENYWGRDDLRGFPELVVAYNTADGTTVYAGVASYPMFDVYDLDAWDDRYTVGMGGSHVMASLAPDGSSTAYGDYNVGLHFYLGRVDPGESRSLCFIYLAGDTLVELESNLVEAKIYAETLCGKPPVGGVVAPPLSIYILTALLILLSAYYIKRK